MKFFKPASALVLSSLFFVTQSAFAVLCTSEDHLNKYRLVGDKIPHGDNKPYFLTIIKTSTTIIYEFSCKKYFDNYGIECTPKTYEHYYEVQSLGDHTSVQLFNSTKLIAILSCDNPL